MDKLINHFETLQLNNRDHAIRLRALLRNLNDNDKSAYDLEKMGFQLESGLKLISYMIQAVELMHKAVQTNVVSNSYVLATLKKEETFHTETLYKQFVDFKDAYETLFKTFEETIKI